MKKNSLFQIYSGSRISNCLKLVKRAVSFFPPRIVMAGLLVMMLSVTIIPAKEPTSLTNYRLPENLELEVGSSCSFGPPLPLQEQAWQYAVSGQKPPVGFETARALLLLTSELPPDRPASLDAVDPQIGSYRLLSGAVIGLHDDAGKPVASISTSRANNKTLYSMYARSVLVPNWSRHTDRCDAFFAADAGRRRLGPASPRRRAGTPA